MNLCNWVSTALNGNGLNSIAPQNSQMTTHRWENPPSSEWRGHEDPAERAGALRTRNTRFQWALLCWSSLNQENEKAENVLHARESLCGLLPASLKSCIPKKLRCSPTDYSILPFAAASASISILRTVERHVSESPGRTVGRFIATRFVETSAKGKRGIVLPEKAFAEDLQQVCMGTGMEK